MTAHRRGDPLSTFVMALIALGCYASLCLGDPVAKLNTARTRVLVGETILLSTVGSDPGAAVNLTENTIAAGRVAVELHEAWDRPAPDAQLIGIHFTALEPGTYEIGCCVPNPDNPARPGLDVLTITAVGSEPDPGPDPPPDPGPVDPDPVPPPAPDPGPGPPPGPDELGGWAQAARDKVLEVWPQPGENVVAHCKAMSEQVYRRFANEVNGNALPDADGNGVVNFNDAALRLLELANAYVRRNPSWSAFKSASIMQAADPRTIDQLRDLALEIAAGLESVN